MRALRFWKLSGAGNDFVLIEAAALKAARLAPATAARRLCDRKRGVGADGLLVVDARRRPASLRYFNADGSAAFCGNGTRCAAAWLRAHGRAGASFALDTNAGLVRAQARPSGRMAIAMPRPKALELGLTLPAAGRRWTIHFIDTGVPHAVAFVNDVDAVDVVSAGRALRRHAAFSPAGANVDFAAAAPRGLLLRTYERGVEDETLACGTGAVAVAVVAAALGRAKPPVRLLTRGGDVLTVAFRKDASGFGDVWLEGPAELVFEGEIQI